MGQFFAQAQVPDNDRARAVGMFTAMFLIPHFYGPALGEWSLDHWGETGFFALPIVSIAIRDAADPAAQSVIRNRNADSKARRIYRPAAQSKSTSTQSGRPDWPMDFSLIFYPQLLVERRTAVAMFFTPFAVTLLLVRFVAMKYLQRLSPSVLVSLGLIAYAGGFYVLVGSTTPAFSITTGILMGLGYGIVLPACVNWSVQYYPQSERARPVALINTSFNIGTVVALQITGTALALIGWSGVLIVLGALIVLVVMALMSTVIATRGAHKAVSREAGAQQRGAQHR